MTARVPTDPEYAAYVRIEWNLFQGDPGRRRAALAAVDGRPAKRILDIGCGAGQELIPFLGDPAAFGIGTDSVPDVGLTADLFESIGLRRQVAFVRADAEALPYRSGSIDVIVSRLALPYTDNRRALEEMARVVRADGIILLKIHHLRFYARDLRDAVQRLKPFVLLHTARVLLAGAMYSVTGRQPRNRIVGTETFQTKKLLQWELSKLGLAITDEMPDSNPATPSFIVIKTGTR
jgi:SAM-dependent methyltransferase